jgi:hypothetical protein
MSERPEEALKWLSVNPKPRLMEDIRDYISCLEAKLEKAKAEVERLRAYLDELSEHGKNVTS